MHGHLMFGCIHYITLFLTVEGHIHPKLSKLNATGLWCYDCFIDTYQESHLPPSSGYISNKLQDATFHTTWMHIYLSLSQPSCTVVICGHLAELTRDWTKKKSIVSPLVSMVPMFVKLLQIFVMLCLLWIINTYIHRDISIYMYTHTHSKSRDTHIWDEKVAGYVIFWLFELHHKY
jgi:hypothetical protein